ncbi:MAG: hypothetical protein ACO1SV_19525 [Fimbriimonas sp.]
MKPSMVPLIAAVTVASAFAGVQALTPAQTAKRQQSLSNAKQVAIALVMYTGDWDDVHPATNSTAGAIKLVTPYLKDAKIWRTENAGARLLFNTNLSGVSSVILPSPADVPLVYESKSWPDGGRIVGYVDGHVKIEPSSRWPSIEKLLKKKWPKAKPRKKGR